MSLCLMIGHYQNKSTTKSRSIVYFILVANELINIVLILFQRVLVTKYIYSCICKETILLNIVNNQSNCRNCGYNSKQRKKNNVGPMPHHLFQSGCLSFDLSQGQSKDNLILLIASLISFISKTKAVQERPVTLRKIILGNTKVIGMSENDPNKFTKSPMKGKAAVTNVLNEKRTARTQNLRLMFSFESILSSSLRNLVSRVS